MMGSPFSQSPAEKREEEELEKKALEERIKAINELMELGFDEVRAGILLAEGVQVHRAEALVAVRKCPVDLAFEILR